MFDETEIARISGAYARNYDNAEGLAAIDEALRARKIDPLALARECRRSYLRMGNPAGALRPTAEALLAEAGSDAYFGPGRYAYMSALAQWLDRATSGAYIRRQARDAERDLSRLIARTRQGAS